MASIAASHGFLLLGCMLSSARGQCTYQFPARRTIFALETQAISNHGNVVLAAGNFMTATFEDIPLMDLAVNTSGVSLFVIPTFHAVSSAFLEVAVAVGAVNDTTEDEVGGASKASALLENDILRNASQLESRGTVDGWSVSDAQSTKGSVAWEACRYYEIGSIHAGVRQIMSEASSVNNATQVEVYVRHQTGPTAFIEGSTDTYVNNVVLQIRSTCDWVSAGSASSSFAGTEWDYIDSSTESQTGHHSSYFSDEPREAWSEGPIKDGRRHSLCGGEYLDNCDLGPYLFSDIGDGSCQQHLNTEGCHYDGGDCCSITCAMESSTEKTYNCQESDLDPYFCRDPSHSMNLSQYAYGENSAARAACSCPRSTLQATVMLIMIFTASVSRCLRY